MRAASRQILCVDFRRHPPIAKLRRMAKKILSPPNVLLQPLYIKPGSPWENGHIESFS
jgi:hypothetical protein